MTTFENANLESIDDMIVTFASEIANKFLNTYYCTKDPTQYWPPESAIVSYLAEKFCENYIPAPEIRIKYLYDNFHTDPIPPTFKKGRMDLVLFDKKSKPLYAIEVKGKSSQWEKFGSDISRLKTIVNEKKPIVSRAAIVYVSCTMENSGLVIEQETFNEYVKQASIPSTPIHNYYGNSEYGNGLISMCTISAK